MSVATESRLIVVNPEAEELLEKAMDVLWNDAADADPPEWRDGATRLMMSNVIIDVFTELGESLGGWMKMSGKQSWLHYLADECKNNPGVDEVRVGFYIGVRDFGGKFIESVDRKINAMKERLQTNNEVW